MTQRTRVVVSNVNSVGTRMESSLVLEPRVLSRSTRASRTRAVTMEISVLTEGAIRRTSAAKPAAPFMSDLKIPAELGKYELFGRGPVAKLVLDDCECLFME